MIKKNFFTIQDLHLVKMREGKKIYDLRLCDLKTKDLMINDIISYSSKSFGSIEMKVLGIEKAYSFEEFIDLLSTNFIEKTGFSSREELIKEMNELYPITLQNRCGVVAIRLEQNKE